MYSRRPPCPYFDIALSHREICEMEQEMMADLLGPGVGVKLSGCIIDGMPAPASSM